ncbi:MAG: hypothetical protein JWO07_855 [Candidatus Saccharibacteria bacterium]|nr:hypothetical protein [Candidatus Saccharibacteria bacterium]
MIPPLFKNLFEKMSFKTHKENSPVIKTRNKTRGDNSPVTNIVDNSTNNNVTKIYNQKFTQQEIIAEKIKQKGPTPFEIREDISKRPPYQREEAGTYYEGNKVIWKLELAMINKYDDTLLSVIGTYKKEDELFGQGVVCYVVKSQYPRLQTIHEDEVYYVEGTIESVDALGLIELMDATLIFPES